MNAKMYYNRLAYRRPCNISSTTQKKIKPSC